MRMDGGGAAETHCFSDFPHGRWVTTVSHVGVDEFQNGALAGGESFGHGPSVRVFAPKVKHLFVLTLDIRTGVRYVNQTGSEHPFVILVPC